MQTHANIDDILKENKDKIAECKQYIAGHFKSIKKNEFVDVNDNGVWKVGYIKEIDPHGGSFDLELMGWKRPNNSITVVKPSTLNIRPASYMSTLETCFESHYFSDPTTFINQLSKVCGS